MDDSSSAILNYLMGYFSQSGISFLIKTPGFEIKDDFKKLSIPCEIYINGVLIGGKLFDIYSENNEFNSYTEGFRNKPDLVVIIKVERTFYYSENLERTIEDVKRLKISDAFQQINEDSKIKDTSKLFKYIIGKGKVPMNWKPPASSNNITPEIVGKPNLPPFIIYESIDPIKLIIRSCNNTTIIYVNRLTKIGEISKYIKEMTQDDIKLIFNGVLLKDSDCITDLKGKIIDIMY